MKKVSAIVPCYNASMYLDKCIEQLLHQTIGLENIEIILVNDASTDNGETWRVIMKYEKQFPDTIIAISLEHNMRQGGARNVGISYASGEYLIFCDADDYLALEAMEHLYKNAKIYNADVVQYGHRNFIEGLNISTLVQEGDGSQLVEIENADERKSFLLNEGYALTNNCWKKCYRMSMIQEHHIRFAEHLAFEEPAFTVPVLLYEKRHYFLDEILYFYRLTPNSTMSGNWDKYKTDNIQVWRVLVQDLQERELLQEYYDEIAYLFYAKGYAYNIGLLIQKGYILTREELESFRSLLLDSFPDISKNCYLVKENAVFRKLVRATLNMEFTAENVKIINDGLKNFYKMVKETKKT